MGSHSASVLIVTRNFPPLVGGMENVNRRLFEALSGEWPVALCGPTGCSTHAPGATEVSESRTKPLLGFFASILWKSVWAALRSRPMLVIAGSGLTLPMAWVAAKLGGARVGVYLHGLDIIAPSRVYQLFWPRFIKRCDLVFVNSNLTAKLALAKGASEDRVHVLHPGTVVPDLDPDARKRFRNRMGLGDELVMLSVGRLTKRKGLAEFISMALPEILASEPLAKLVIIGEEATDSLTATGISEKQRLIEAAVVAGVASAVMFAGRLGDKELGDAYQSADTHVFPVLELPGDIEGFGMVALESAAHGLRTVAFAVGGIPDAVDDPATGTLVKSGDYSAFAEAVTALLRSCDTSILACRAFARKKSWDEFGARARGLIRRALANG